MTRKKKSRNPGVAPASAKSPLSKKSLVVTDKKQKKHKGKRPGNRQLEADKKQRNQEITAGNKDPRLGSKKAIVLEPAVKPVVAKKHKPSNPVQQNSAPIDNTPKWLKELESIEQDEKLLNIIEKQQQESELTDFEVDYFNETMDRYQTLQQLLGIDDDDDESTVTSPSIENDEALWQRWDSNEFDDFNDPDNNK